MKLNIFANGGAAAIAPTHQSSNWVSIVPSKYFFVINPSTPDSVIAKAKESNVQV